MSGGGKSGAQNQSKLYYGTLAGAICWGPLDWLDAVIHNGNYLWQGSLPLTADVTDLTGSIADPNYIAPGGYLKIYRGTETQPGDASIPNSPADKGTAKIVARHLLFGQDTGTAPNLQIIGGRVPRVPATIVAADDNVADDGQVNPVAAFAEILLDERGGGLPEELFDAASWLDAAHWAYLNRTFAFCSPLLTEQGALRELARQLLEPFSGFCRWTESGKLACRVYEWGADPGGLITLDARHFLKRPQMPLGDWVDIPTELLVTFTDRAYEFQENTLLVANARAYQVRQQDDQRRIERRHVTRSAQAHRHVVEYLRRISAAPARATLSIRRPFVETLAVGDKVKLDTDPEPGGSGLAQLARIERIVQDATDAATVEVLTDNLLAATPYTPGLTPADVDDGSSLPIAHKLAIPLPPASFGWPLAVGILATRPARNIDGMRVFFAAQNTDSFDEIGTQFDFACRGQLAADLTAGATALSVTELDGETGPEASLAAYTPGGNLTAAQNNTLLIVLAQVDGNGRVALDGNGDPVMEFVSVIDRSGAGDTRTYSVLRGRLDTPARAWTAGAAAWILPRGNITEWTPDYLRDLTGSVVWFRLVSFNGEVEDETSPVPEVSCQMIDENSPMYQRGLEGANSASVFIYQRAASPPALPSNPTTYAFATGILTGLDNGWSQTIPAGTEPLYVSVAAAIATGPSDTIDPSEWSATRVLAQNGAAGAPGNNGANNATVFIYKRAAAAPALPTSTATYTFETGVLTGLDNGWSQSVPATNGLPLYAAAATASSTATTDTIAPGEWAAPVVIVQDGANGASGANSASIFIYKRAAESPTPSLPSADSVYTFATGVLSGLNNGWTQAIPSGSDPLWVSTATPFSTGATDTVLSSEWAPAAIFAKNGAPGGSLPPVVEAGMAPVTSPGIRISKPAAAPDGWYVRYSIGDGVLNEARNFPFTVSPANASTFVNVTSSAPGYADAFQSESWNSLSL